MSLRRFPVGFLVDVRLPGAAVAVKDLSGPLSKAELAAVPEVLLVETLCLEATGIDAGLVADLGVVAAGLTVCLPLNKLLAVALSFSRDDICFGVSRDSLATGIGAGLVANLDVVAVGLAVCLLLSELLAVALGFSRDDNGFEVSGDSSLEWWKLLVLPCLQE